MEKMALNQMGCNGLHIKTEGSQNVIQTAIAPTCLRKGREVGKMCACV